MRVRKNSFYAKITVAFYIFLLLLISISPIVCLSDPPVVSVNDITVAGQDIVYTNKTYANISVTVSGTDVSSFINWDDSLVGYWNFEAPGAFGYVNDNSSYNNAADFTDGRSWDNSTDGKYGYGFYFNGSDQGHLTVDSDNSLNITDELTIELWIKEFETTFSKTFGGEYNDYGYSVQQTSDGGYIITGEYNCHIDVNTGDIIIIKTDLNGNVNTDSNSWKTIIKNKDGGENIGNSVKQTSEGGYIITGSTYNASEPENLNLCLIKINSTGYYGSNDVSTWFKSYGQSEDEEGSSIQQTSEGGYIITGYTKSFGATKRDTWILKTNSMGNYTPNNSTMWSSVIKTLYGEDDRGWSVQQTADGEYIIAGYIGITPNDRNLSLIKYKSDGTVNWSENYGWGMYDLGYSVEQTNDRGYIITGYTNCTNLTSLERGDLWILKTDENGTTIWNMTYGGANFNVGRSVKQTRDGGYIIAGQTNNTDNEDHDVWLIKTNASGNELWNRTHGGNLDDKGWKIQQTTDGGYIIIGETNSSDNQDIWLIKTDAYGNITQSNNSQSLNKTLVGKGRRAYQLELHNGTIYGYLNNNSLVSNESSLYNLSQQWNHVVLTYNHTNVKLYLNKKEVASATFTGDISRSQENLIIGKNFSGIMDEIRIWNRSLSWEEINASYNCSQPYYKNFTGLSEGNYNYSICSIDSNGNETETEGVFLIDNTAPICTIDYNSSSTYFAAGAHLKIFANFIEPDSGMDNNTVTIYISTEGNGDLVQTSMNKTNFTHYYYNWPIPSGSDDDGNFMIMVNGSDNATNSVSQTSSAKKIDNTGPTFITGIEFNKTENYYNGSDLVKIFANFTETGSGIDETSVKITITNISSGSVLNNSILMTPINNTHWYFDWHVPDDQNCNVNISIEANDNVSNTISGINFTTTKDIDNIHPEISGVNASSITYYSAKINWTTNENGTGRVEYGLTNSYGDSKSNILSNYTTLTGLSSNKQYHYRVICYDIAGNMANSTDYTFTTLKQSPGGGNGDSSATPQEQTNETSENITQNQNDTDTINIVDEIDFFEEKIENITAGEYIKTNITSEKTIIICIEFESKINLTNVTIKINDTQNLKDDIDEPTIEDLQKYFQDKNVTKILVYKFVNINISTNNTYILQNIIKNAKITFKIDKTWNVLMT